MLSPLGITSKSDHFLAITLNPNHSGVSPKPNQAAIASKSVSNIHTPSTSHSDQDDNASLMIEDAPNESSFGDKSPSHSL